MVCQLKAARQEFFQIFLRAAGQVKDLAATVAFKVVVVRQVRFLVKRFTAWHLHGLDFTRFEQGVDCAIDGCLPDRGVFFLRQLDQIGNAEWALRLHNDSMDQRALLGLALSDFYHRAEVICWESTHRCNWKLVC